MLRQGGNSSFTMGKTDVARDIAFQPQFYFTFPDPGLKLLELYTLSYTCLHHNNHFIWLVWHSKFCRRRSRLYFTVNGRGSWPDNSGTHVSSEQRGEICRKTRQTSSARWADDEIWPQFPDLGSTDDWAFTSPQDNLHKSLVPAASISTTTNRPRLWEQLGGGRDPIGSQLGHSGWTSELATWWTGQWSTQYRCKKALQQAGPALCDSNHRDRSSHR